MTSNGHASGDANGIANGNVANGTAPASSSTTAATHQAPVNVHLVVFVHGLWGQAQHLAFVARSLAKAQGGHLLEEPRAKRAEEKAAAATKKPKNAKKLKKEQEQQEKEEKAIADLLGKMPAYAKDGEEKGRHKLVVLNTVSNAWVNTYDGIDLCAERVAREIKMAVQRIRSAGRGKAKASDEEVEQEAEDREQDAALAKHLFGGDSSDATGTPVRIDRFSIVGYSLGGLISRYVVGLLYSQGLLGSSPSSDPDSSMKPCTFYTFATPHIGMPRARSSFGKLAAFIGARSLSRSGRQLYNLDDDWGPSTSSPSSSSSSEASSSASNSSSASSRGLIEVMAEPSSIFYRALQQFDSVIIYANGINDITVPFQTGAFEYDDPFILEGTEVTLADGYEHLVESYTPQSDRCQPDLTLSQRLRKSLPSVPIFLKPSRIPMRFPLNYAMVFASPIILPLFITIFLVRSAGQTSASAKRIREEELRWLEEQAELEQEKHSHAAAASTADTSSHSSLLSGGTSKRVQMRRQGTGERIGPPSSRIQRILAMASDVVQDAAENNIRGDVEAGTHGLHAQAHHRRSKVSEGQVYESRNLGKILAAEADGDDPRYPGSTLAPLSPQQRKMVKHLNNLPNVVKRFSYFDVTNSHGVIIARTPAIPMLRQGRDIVQHFAETFSV